ncbi:MAG: hypothetical protein ACD_3C00037G0008 [uncultured bacterium (gcode 4)]|uniref:Oxidized purine nucleoside triphosphate hydrolase n=1 Tax=uncultured bacterium (gcode 4) TaxID=1234023 RepID=K2G2X1_9BACT|nr:MAG: hypothetical protein ACD_3C00037G0008 [uncultured bacterium (gcode 4)]
MIQSNLVFVFDWEWENILLCMKKRGFWVWKWNWPGWKVGLDETILEWAKRELSEETWIDIPQEELEYRWILHFFHHWKPEWDQDVNIFVHHGYTWEFYETEEMLPKWYPISEIPYDKMWEDDNTWLPILISWEEFEFTFKFWENWKIIEWQRHK